MFISLLMALSWARNSYILLALTSFLIFICESKSKFRYNVSKCLALNSTMSQCQPAPPYPLYHSKLHHCSSRAHCQTWKSLIIFLLLLQSIIKYCQFYLQNTASIMQSLISGSSYRVILLKYKTLLQLFIEVRVSSKLLQCPACTSHRNFALDIVFTRETLLKYLLTVSYKYFQMVLSQRYQS